MIVLDHPFTGAIEDAARVLTEGVGDWMLWSGSETVLVAGARASVLHRGGELRVFDADGRLAVAIETADPFVDLKALVERGELTPARAYGYLGYGAAASRFPYTKSRGPSLHFIVPRIACSLRREGVLRIEGQDDDVQECVAKLASVSRSGRADRRTPILDLALVEAGREAYLEGVAAIQAAIARGEVDKVILARHITVPGALDPLATFEASAPSAAERRFAFRLGGVAGAGVCPAILLSADTARRVQSTPLAGTMPRGKSAAEDAELERRLLRDTKELAEHAASARLAYDELCSVVTAESASIVDFMRVKRYAFTQHLASTVTGTLRPGCSSWDALRALFPGVTATGLPKEQAIGFIDRLEPIPRGVYGGCVGWASGDGSMDWGIAIRSAFDYGEGVVLSAGAGIVEASDAEREFEESAAKMRTMASRVVLQARR